MYDEEEESYENDDYDINSGSESDDNKRSLETYFTNTDSATETKLDEVTHKISIIDNKLFEENDDDYEIDPENHPLNQGLFFKLLFKQFTTNFIKSSQIEDNLLMTSIFAKLASISICDAYIETYYLHAFMFCEIKNDSNSLLKSIASISNQIKSQSDFEEFNYLKSIVKTRLENPDVNIPLQKTFSTDVETLKAILKEKGSVITGSILFEEFLKEYLSIFDSKYELIKLMNIYKRVSWDDQQLDRAIQVLCHPKKERYK